MKHHLKCPHCDRKFINSTPWALKANLANHLKAAHPEHYVPKKQPPTVGFGPPPTKRHYNRKPKTTAPLLEVNHCPQCGCNIRAVKVAMGL